MPSRIDTPGLPKAVLSREDALLQKFAVSKNGFLPEKLPLARLPQEYYSHWECLLDRLPHLIRTHTIRDAISRLETLSTKYLETEEEWRRAYVILIFFTHAYIWGGAVAAEVLPPAIVTPLLSVCSHLDNLPPVATYAGLNLWNFTLRDHSLLSSSSSSSPDFSQVDNLVSLHTMTGTEDESWFYCVSVAMEAKGGAILPLMVRAIEEATTASHQQQPNLSLISKALDKLAITIRDVATLLERMYERCDPEVFYHQIRPFLAGSSGMAAAGLPRGVFYSEDENDLSRGSWREYRGGSNGQSSLIQSFDMVLGVEHTGGNNYHEAVRQYMPGPHREFLEFAGKGGKKLREFCLFDEEGKGEESREGVRDSFRGAVDALGELRSRHMQVVSRYIVIPSRKAAAAAAAAEKIAKEKQQEAGKKNEREREVVANLASASAKVGAGDEDKLTGTGGTALIPFLKKTRDETYVAAGRV